MTLLYRVAHKKTRMAHFQHDVNTVADIEVASEKNDTKISNFGSVLCFLGHILWDNVKIPKFPLLV